MLPLICLAVAIIAAGLAWTEEEPALKGLFAGIAAVAIVLGALTKGRGDWNGE